MVEVIDTGGLICGFRLHADAPAEALHWDVGAGANGELPEADERPLWLHFNFADTRADRWIAECEHIPPAARELLLENDPRIRLEPLGNGLAGVLGDLHHDFEINPEGLGVLRIYIGEQLVVSGRDHPLESSNRLRRELRAGESVGSSLMWLTHLVHQMAETFGAAVHDLNHTVEDTEDRILNERFTEEGKALGRVRRLLARLRRHLGANRQALLHARARLPRWARDEDVTQLRLAIERLDAVAQDLDSVQERARLLQEEIASRIGEQTNRNVYVLSIVTAVMLPITLVSGIFGMNVGGLPWLQDPSGFDWTVALMLIVGGATLALLRWRKLI
jgi:zinc transporter